MSRYFGLIGEKLPHSLSKPIHEALWADEYHIIELARKDFPAFLAEKRFDGINVTIPYKRDVIQYCDFLDERAQSIGSVNTIVKDEHGKLHGYNTDFDGFVFLAQRSGIAFKGKKAVILGTGGTSLTAESAAKYLGARETVKISRSGDDNYGNLSRHADADILVNTTPVGMYPDVDGCPCPLEVFKELSGVIDVVYNPLKTALVLGAERRGIPCTGGLPMLVRQAAAAAEFFCKREIASEETERVLNKIWNERVNIVLVGMPGSGKTSIGRAVAELLCRDFYDIDEIIERIAGVPIPEIFQEHGEEHFREIETAAIEQAVLNKGAVVATGGGAVMRKQNRDALKRDGRVYLIERDLSELATKGRPLSSDPESLERMLKTRVPIYKQLADRVIANDKTIAGAAQLIKGDMECAF